LKYQSLTFFILSSYYGYENWTKSNIDWSPLFDSIHTLF
jgi:hypothetical protein